MTYNNGTDYYYTTRDQCEFSYLDRTIKMDMQAPLKYQALAYGKNYPDVSFPTTTVLFGSDIDAVTPKDFISTYLRSISSNQESPKVFSDIRTYCHTIQIHKDSRSSFLIGMYQHGVQPQTLKRLQAL